MKFVAIVDDDDYEMLMQYNWCILKSSRKSGTDYVRGVVNGKIELLHVFIMNPQLGMEVDHIDGNGLNNQRYNLRICTHNDNVKNRAAHGKSKYLGVIIVKSRRIGSLEPYEKFRARITINGKETHIGYFTTEEDAARAYDIAAKKYFGEFANLNFK